MSRFRNKLVALLLLAVWLVATQHCAIEAAGLLAGHDDGAPNAGCCTPNGKGCEEDGCGSLENGLYRSETQLAKASAPSLSTHWYLFCLEQLAVPPANEIGWAALIPPERFSAWVPAWSFERRTAAPAHAPDSVIA